MKLKDLERPIQDLIYVSGLKADGKHDGIINWDSTIIHWPKGVFELFKKNGWIEKQEKYAESIECPSCYETFPQVYRRETFEGVERIFVACGDCGSVDVPLYAIELWGVISEKLGEWIAKQLLKVEEME